MKYSILYACALLAAAGCQRNETDDAAGAPASGLSDTNSQASLRRSELRDTVGSEIKGVETEPAASEALEPRSTNAAPREPDNTGVNTRDRDDATLTAKDQGGSAADRAITQAIRKSIVVEPGKDEHSFSAKNIKIITRDGVVTLRGAVRSEQEKADIEARAKSAAGVARVDNQLEVKP